MPKPKPKPAPGKPAPKGGKGGVFTRKIGPLPAWAWAVIAGVLVGVAWYMMGRKGGGGTSGGPSSSTDASSPNSMLGPTPQDLAGAGSPSTASAPAAGLDQGTLDALNAQNEQVAGALSDIGSRLASNEAAVGELSGVLSSLGGTITTSGASDSSTSSTAQTDSTGQRVTSGAKAPAGSDRAVSHKTLKSGAVVTTYASGRKVQSATPGKKGSTAYVIYDPTKARARGAAQGAAAHKPAGAKRAAPAKRKAPATHRVVAPARPKSGGGGGKKKIR